jgi:hypothetical protein
MLVSECMADDEALLILGTERFAATSGYGFSLRFAGHLASRVREEFLHRQCVVRVRVGMVK